MKELICGICRNRNCPGEEFLIEGWPRTLCNHDIFEQDGKFYQRNINGYWDRIQEVKAIRIDPSDPKYAKEVQYNKDNK